MSTNVTKLIVMGLDNAGKTSIILSLTKKANLLDFCSIKPTQGLNIVNIDDDPYMKFNIWDFGGQEGYRGDYFKKMDDYLVDVERFIYVIDTQDPERYELALQYLTDLIQTLKNSQKKLELSIFLHKCDPSFDLENTFHNRIQVKLIDIIRKIIPSQFKFKIFKTSVYTVFKKKIVE